MTDVTMPQLGETVAEGTVTKWFNKVGDVVVKGQALFEVSTDKVDTEIPAPASGTLSAILVDEGVTVDVGTVLAVIGATSTNDAVATPKVTSTGPASRPNVDVTSHARQLSPAVRRLLEEHHLRAEDVVGSGPGGRLTRGDVQDFVARSLDSSSAAPSNSPVVRRLLHEHQLDATSITATGPHGRLSRRDVDDAIAHGETFVDSSTTDEVVPFTRARRLTAEHMVRSKVTSAHTFMVREVDFEHVEVHRRRHGAAFKAHEGFTLTYLPFIALAVVHALRAFPQMNASVGDDELILHRHVNVGIAVDLDGDGLVVPVIRDADAMDLWSIARTIHELADGARHKRLTLDDMGGGTFTITNPGPYGTLMTGAIINQPQIAILATDAITRTPVVVTNTTGVESITIHSVGLLTLTFDHRAIDGATAARFLRHVDEQLHDRDWVHEQ